MSYLYRKDQDDWDSDGAKKTDDDAHAVALIMRDGCPEVTATLEGGYWFRWHTEEWDIEIAVNPSECGPQVEMWGEAYSLRGRRHVGVQTEI